MKSSSLSENIVKPWLFSPARYSGLHNSLIRIIGSVKGSSCCRPCEKGTLLEEKQPQELVSGFAPWLSQYLCGVSVPCRDRGLWAHMASCPPYRSSPWEQSTVFNVAVDEPGWSQVVWPHRRVLVTKAVSWWLYSYCLLWNKPLGSGGSDFCDSLCTVTCDPLTTKLEELSKSLDLWNVESENHRTVFRYLTGSSTKEVGLWRHSNQEPDYTHVAEVSVFFASRRFLSALSLQDPTHWLFRLIRVGLTECTVSWAWKATHIPGASQQHILSKCPGPSLVWKSLIWVCELWEASQNRNAFNVTRWARHCLTF